MIDRRTVARAAAAGILALLAVAAGTWYVAVRAEIGPGLFAGATEMRFAYEDRIGRLSDRLEQEVTRNLVERTTFEARVAGLAARQAEIETRQAWLRTIAERVAGTDAAAAPPRPAQQRATTEATLPVRPAPLAAEPAFRLRDVSSDMAPQGARPRDRLSALEQAADRVRAEEVRLLGAFGHGTRIRVARLRSALYAAGLDRASPAKSAGGIGGPFEPLPASTRGGHLEALAGELDLGFAELARLKDTIRTLPLGRPLQGETEQTSGFGYRVDPFTRGPALHTGVDFRSEPGAPARATGAGTVVSAEQAGGYGLMVEIDHGGGLTTRYGHLSGFAVVPGERVAAGQIIGRTGSTGRSTGPHLHYETRIDGEPVNPTRFLNAGRLLTDREG